MTSGRLESWDPHRFPSARNNRRNMPSIISIILLISRYYQLHYGACSSSPLYSKTCMKLQDVRHSLSPLRCLYGDLYQLLEYSSTLGGTTVSKKHHAFTAVSIAPVRAVSFLRTDKFSVANILQHEIVHRKTKQSLCSDIIQTIEIVLELIKMSGIHCVRLITDAITPPEKKPWYPFVKNPWQRV